MIPPPQFSPDIILLNRKFGLQGLKDPVGHWYGHFIGYLDISPGMHPV
jgi:hypothetical protein